MEATNISINKQSSVSINIETLAAILQGALQAVKQSIKQRCNVGAIARTIDAHPTLSNLWIGGWAVAYLYLIFMYA